MNQLIKNNGGTFKVDASSPGPTINIDELFVKYHTSLPLDGMKANAKLSFERNLPRFFGTTVKEGVDDEGQPCWRVTWADHPLAIISGGPTLPMTIGIARHFKTIMVAGAAHDYVVSQGVIPHYCVLMDSIPEAIDWLKNPQKGTTYLVASQNDPIMFDHLRDYNVHVWHAMLDEDSCYGDEPTIGGGSTTALRCIELAKLMGYWDQHFFGLDSSYLEDGTTHAYDDWVPPQPLKVKVTTTGRIFKTDLGMLGQAEVFIKTFKEWKGQIRATVHGDNLIAEAVRYDFGSEGIRVAC